VHLTRRGRQVLNLAKVYCPVDHGRLRAGQQATDPVRASVGRSGLGLALQVGSNIDYSLAIHEGSGSRWAPRSWRIAHSRGRPVPARRFLVNALAAGRG
jgi:hypothetical protein